MKEFINENSKKYRVLIVVAAGLLFFIAYIISQNNLIEDSTSDSQDITEQKEVISKRPAPDHVKGIYITAYTTTLPEKMDYLLNLIDETELNSVVIDIKDYTGKLLYDSNVELANKYNLENNILGDVNALIKNLHDRNVYVIARQTVFQDPILAEKKPELAFKKIGGSLWRDYKGLAWVDSSNKEVWNYNVAIAKEAISLGFDEINFDYVRFPSDGNLKNIIYTHNKTPETKDKKKYDVMREFFAYLDTNLKDEPAWTSVDFFGFIMERHDGINIGQRLDDVVDYVDFVSPMMYPSHYPKGHLGLQNPAASPYKVIDNGMAKGLPYFDNKRAKVRPWIQAFNIGAYYGVTNIRAQIDAIEKYDNAGWLLWNASNRYTNAGLESQETVKPLEG